MAALGAVTVDILRGLVQPQKQRMDVWETPGVDGYGALKMGFGDAETDLQSVTFSADIAAARTLKGALGGLQGTVISLTDDWGTNFTRILVKEVGVIVLQPVIYLGNANAVRVTAPLKVCQK